MFISCLKPVIVIYSSFCCVLLLGTLIALAVYYLPTKWYKPQVPKRLNYTWLPMTVCALTVAIFAVTALYSV